MSEMGLWKRFTSRFRGWLRQKPSATVLANLRAGPIDVQMKDNQKLYLAPMETFRLKDVHEINEDKAWICSYVRVVRYVRSPVRAVVPTILFYSTFAFLVFGFVRIYNPMVWIGGALVFSFLWLVTIMWLRSGGKEAIRYVQQQASLSLVIFIAVAIPGIAGWYVGGFSIHETYPWDIHRIFAESADTGGTIIVVAWLLLWLFIVLASLLPALLYFLFDRTQLGTLKHEFIFNVFRLEPGLKNLNDLDAKYGKQIEETYGTPAESAARLGSGRRSPIVVATLLITIGWTALLVTPAHGAVMATIPGGFASIQFWSPPSSLVAFAFLGAYIFGIRLALRGHVRGDLQAKSYSRISVRIIMVVVLAWVIELLLPQDSATMSGLLEGAAFFAGFFPDEWLRYLNEIVRSGLGITKKSRSSDRAHTSLTILDGVDLYDRTRLADEGVNNVQALATPNLVALLMNTRIPAPRLIDWVDQSILRLETQGVGEADSKDFGARLRNLGIRTATQVVRQSDPPDSISNDTLDMERWTSLVASLSVNRTLTSLLFWRTTRIEARPPVDVDLRP
jgi:hypothetical protein